MQLAKKTRIKARSEADWTQFEAIRGGTCGSSRPQTREPPGKLYDASDLDLLRGCNALRAVCLKPLSRNLWLRTVSEPYPFSAVAMAKVARAPRRPS